jgi:hypothetical protein
MCGAEIEDEKHFLLRCSFFQQQRQLLFECLESLVHAAATTGATASSWRVHHESADSQLLLLTTTRHPRIQAGRMQRDALRVILIALAEWTEQHDEHRRRIRSILEEC